MGREMSGSGSRMGVGSKRTKVIQDRGDDIRRPKTMYPPNTRGQKSKAMRVRLLRRTSLSGIVVIDQSKTFV